MTTEISYYYSFIFNNFSLWLAVNVKYVFFYPYLGKVKKRNENFKIRNKLKKSKQRFLILRVT